MKARLVSKLLVLGFVAVSLSACGSTGSWFSSSDDKALDSRPPDVLYKEADGLLEKGSYSKAAETFEKIDQLYPYSPEAKKSIVMAAFAYQKAGKLPEAVAAGRRYLALHPGTKEAALAQQIIAMSYDERRNSITRDQTDTRKAMAELETLIQRYPDSRYADDAKKKLKLSRDTLAGSEMNVGRWYQKKGNYLAAINRFKTVVTEYQTTTHVEEALMRLTECYLALGIANEAETAAAILGHNFPDSPWYKDAYALLKSNGTEPRQDGGSWLSRTWKSTVGSVTG